MPKKPQTDLWGNEIVDTDSKLPPGCSFKRSKLEADEEGKLTRTFYDEEGRVIHIILGSRIHDQTDIPISYSEDPRQYARIYYRNVRRYRDGNKPRVPDLACEPIFTCETHSWRYSMCLYFKIVK